MEGKKAEMRDQQPLEDGHQEILEMLRVAAATLGAKRVTKASVREALESSARAVWLVGSEPLDLKGVEPYRYD